MADNTTTYKAVIETEVKGTKEIDEMNKKAEEGGEKFKSLRSQIKDTTVQMQALQDQGKENTKEFEKLRNKLDDLSVAQDKVNFKSGQFDDQLAALPGPLGSLGKGVQGMGEAVDKFGIKLAIATGGITLIIGAVIAMKDALGKSEQGQEALSKVTDAFSKLLAPLLAMITAVAIPTFEFFAKVITKVADAAEWVATKLGFTKKAIDGFNDANKKASDAFFDQAQKDMDHAVLVANTYKAIDEKNKADAAERNRKYLEKIAEQERVAREKEKKEYEKLIADIEAIRAKRMRVNVDPIGADGMTAKEREKVLKEEAERKAYFQKKQDELTKKMQPQMQAFMLANTRNSLEKQFGLKQEAVKKENKIDAWLNSEKKKKLDDNLMATKAALNIAGNLVDEGSAAAKAIAIAQTGIDTYQSATAAYKAVVGIPVVGPFLAPVAAAAAIAAGLMSVRKILSTEVPKMGDGSAGGGASASAPSIEAPTVAGFSAPDINMGGGQNPTSQIAGTLAAASGKPVKAYVVSTDMSSQQALDRRTSRAATLSGGY
jgi:hypothetical protein